MAGKPSPPKWSQVKRVIGSWGPRELTDLIKDLFDLSAENREFLAARFAPPAVAPRTPYKRRILAAFYRPDGMPRADLGIADARAAIRRYRKAADDPAGTLDLTLFLVETGTEFTRQFGDIDEAFYNSLSTALRECRTILEEEGGRALYAAVRDRFLALANGPEIGWGYGAELVAVVEELELRYGPTA